ncbi:carbon-nitrogen hydrolase family protein [Photobacterium atrarenae]|uniref:Carbon-nitrogen hydrolase family protein n=1 Tax=Photobacterium atrarenae TaxID=865757 RepID=A0ABY5GJZ8_9GAMM|nr:carbon-nitrogen hydrolase family protein [Photobacterium atrarenae]UTV29644.1 carbon-nitrogen hydrolase family protein [Photobacterium atrarenae]
MSDERITVSLVQAPVFKGDISANLTMHLDAIAASARQGADVVVFPELSLTGYELSLAGELTLDSRPEVIQLLSEAAMRHQVVVIAGGPLAAHGDHQDDDQEQRQDPRPYIGAIICLPCGAVENYAKQYLHEGEATFCAAGERNITITYKGYTLALAICADFSNPAHAADAAANGADLYLASALISEAGYAADAQILSEIARSHQLPVLLANHCCETGGWITCGSSGMWDPYGELVVAAEGIEPGMVLCTLKGAAVSGKMVCFADLTQ